jgi:hypothetical protein
MAHCGWEETLNEETQDMNAKERLLRITRAQNSLLRAKNHLRLAQNSIRKEYDLCVQEAADADGFVADSRMPSLGNRSSGAAVTAGTLAAWSGCPWIRSPTLSSSLRQS